MHYSFNKQKKVYWDKVELPNIPLFSASLTENIVNKLWEYIEKSKQDIQKNDQNSKLAGNISQSLRLHDEDDYLMKNLFNDISKLYLNPPAGTILPWNKSLKSTSHVHNRYVLNSIWVNFQRQTEFNPVHDHSGLLSFVIWLKVPTNWQEQHELIISKQSNCPSASDFQLMYTDILGNICTNNILMSKEIENVILLFPSQLKHCVYPFYNSDEERISVSGNISLDSTSYMEWS